MKLVLSLPWRRVSSTLMAIVALATLAACQRDQQSHELVRPVRTLELASSDPMVGFEFPGDVRARVESRLGFRVGGKLVERRVSLGDRVVSGQVLARLDPQDLQLAQAAARSQLEAASVDRSLAEANFKRYDDLYRQNFISKAELDNRRAALDAAQARVAQAQANWDVQRNQAAYSTLMADAPGVVTAVEAEVGQVLAAGTPVIRLARDHDKEVVITIPEDRLGLVKMAPKADVSFWALPGKSYSAQVREVAAAADATTRTFTVKLALPQAPEIVLGMSATARFTTPGMANSGVFRLPVSALVNRGDRTFVWVVDPASMTVKSVVVNLSGSTDVDVLVDKGLAAGQRVVTAGANLLAEGQKVRWVEVPVAGATP